MICEIEKLTKLDSFLFHFNGETEKENQSLISLTVVKELLNWVIALLGRPVLDESKKRRN